MFRFHHCLLIPLLFFSIIVSSGCGSNGDDDFVAVGPLASTGQVAGKLFLGTDIPNVPVTLETLDGQVVTSSTTDGSGNFLLRGVFPADFRVVARLDDGLEFTREIRGHGERTTFAAITVPTTLASLLARQNPGAPLASHESQVRQALGIPAGVSLARLNESVTEPFSHLAFFVAAAERGGSRNFVNEVVNGSTTAEVPFLLREETLAGAIAEDNELLASRLRELQQDPFLRRSAFRLMARGLSDSAYGNLGYRRAVSVRPANSRAILAQEGEVIGEVAEDVAKSVLEKVADKAVESIFDAITGNDSETYSAAQMAYYIGGQLEQIESDLTMISDQIAAIQDELEQAALSALLKDADMFSDDITILNGQLISAQSTTIGIGDEYFSDEPKSTIPPEVTTIVTALGAQSALGEVQTDVRNLQQVLAGTGPPSTSSDPILVDTDSTGSLTAERPNLVLAQRDQVFQGLGFSNDERSQRMANFPVRSAQILDEVLGPWETYGGSQVLAANLLGEIAHLSPNLEAATDAARTDIENVIINLQNTRAQVPDYPLSDRYFIDLQAGLIWYMSVQDPMSASDMATFAESFDDGISNNWRAPADNELYSLLLRTGYTLEQDGVANVGNNVDFFSVMNQKLGFDVPPPNNEFQQPLGCPHYTWNGSSWVINAIASYVPTTGAINSDGEAYFLMVRTIGKEPADNVKQHLNPPNTVSFNSNTDSWPSSFTQQDIPEAEYTSVGTFQSYTDAFVENERVVVTGTWEVNAGANSYKVFENRGHGTDYERNLGEFPGSDALPPTYFQADNGNTTVSNSPSTFGQLTRHLNADQPTEIGVHSLGTDSPNEGANFPVAQSITVTTQAAVPSITLDHLQITPRNITLNATTEGKSQQFVALNFYSDDTYETVTNEVTWTVEDSSGGPAVGAEFSSSTNGLLVVDTGVTGGSTELRVTATITVTGNPSGTSTDSTLVAVQRP